MDGETERERERESERETEREREREREGERERGRDGVREGEVRAFLCMPCCIISSLVAVLNQTPRSHLYIDRDRNSQCIMRTYLRFQYQRNRDKYCCRPNTL